MNCECGRAETIFHPASLRICILHMVYIQACQPLMLPDPSHNEHLALTHSTTPEEHLHAQLFSLTHTNMIPCITKSTDRDRQIIIVSHPSSVRSA